MSDQVPRGNQGPPRSNNHNVGGYQPTPHVMDFQPPSYVQPSSLMMGFRPSALVTGQQHQSYVRLPSIASLAPPVGDPANQPLSDDDASEDDMVDMDDPAIPDTQHHGYNQSIANDPFNFHVSRAPQPVQAEVEAAQGLTHLRTRQVDQAAWIPSEGHTQGERSTGDQFRCNYGSASDWTPHDREHGTNSTNVRPSTRASNRANDKPGLRVHFDSAMNRTNRQRSDHIRNQTWSSGPAYNMPSYITPTRQQHHAGISSGAPTQGFASQINTASNLNNDDLFERTRYMWNRLDDIMSRMNLERMPRFQ